MRIKINEMNRNATLDYLRGDSWVFLVGSWGEATLHFIVFLLNICEHSNVVFSISTN